MDKHIYSLLGSISTSPYMIGAKFLNSQYAKIETLYEQKRHTDCVSASSALFEELMKSLYLAVTGEKQPLSVILSDIGFWDVIGNEEFSDTALMFQYACYRLLESAEDDAEPETVAELTKVGLDNVIGYIAKFLSQHGAKKCLDPGVLQQDDARERIHRLTDSLRMQMEAAGCSDGMSMQPPFMNACLINFPEKETIIWVRYIAARLCGMGLLSSAEVKVLDAEQVVTERVGLTNEFIRRASAGANGGVLLVEHFEEFDMPCLGGNLLDRALKTIITAADTYRGSLCIVIAGQGANVEKTIRRAERGGECFPLIIALEE